VFAGRHNADFLIRIPCAMQVFDARARFQRVGEDGDHHFGLHFVAWHEHKLLVRLSRQL
jgi:hypothetical protein